MAAITMASAHLHAARDPLPRRPCLHKPPFFLQCNLELMDSIIVKIRRFFAGLVADERS